MGESGSGTADHREQFDVEVILPVLVGQRLEGAWVSATGVVHEDVYPAQRVGGFGEELPDLGGVRHVAGTCEDLAAVRAQLISCRGYLFGATSAYGDVGALAGKLVGDRLSEALRPSGDDGFATLEP